MRYIIFFLISFKAWGYQFTSDFANGFYWENLPINIKVSESNPGLKSYLEQIVSESLFDWEVSTNLNIWQEDSATTNVVRWSTNFSEETGADKSSVLAVAVRYTGGPYMIKTEIIVNGEHVFNQYEDNLKAVILHELGHTIGLDHSHLSQAVMYSSISYGGKNLNYDDIDGMMAIVDETQRRQAIGYVSPLAYSEETQEQNQISCGTIDLRDDGSSGGTGSVIFGLLLGSLLFLIFGKKVPIRKV